MSWVTAEDSGGGLFRFDNHNPPGPFEPTLVHPEHMSLSRSCQGSTSRGQPVGELDLCFAT